MKLKNSICDGEKNEIVKKKNLQSQIVKKKKTKIVTKLKNLKCDKSYVLTKLKNFIVIQLKNSNCDIT